MVDTGRSFDDSAELLMSDLDKDMNENILLQGRLLNSDRFNETMENIESELNLLYEKTRVLEDMIAYSKEFLAQEIHINKEKIYDKLKLIEESRDTLKERSYVSYRVPIQTNSSNVVRDRDGTVIDRCDVDNGNLVLSGQELETLKIIDVNKSQELLSYNNTLDELKKGNEYRTFYLLDGPARNGVKEEITFLFEDAKRLNYVSAKLANCQVLNATFINENGAEDQVIHLDNSLISERLVRGVKLTIMATEYETLVYDIDKDRVQRSFWENVALSEYQRVNSQKTTFDLEKASGLEDYEKEYDKYLAEIDEWEKKKLASEERNKLALQKYQQDYEKWIESQRQQGGD